MQSARFSVFAIALTAGISIAGCSGTPNVNQANVSDVNQVSKGGSGGFAGVEPGIAGSSAQGGSLMLDLPDDMAGSPGIVGAPSDPYPDRLPVGFAPANIFGGYRVGDEITAAGGGGDQNETSTESCGTTILAVIRDFKADHKNFEGPAIGDNRNMVLPQLGADRKPVFATASNAFTVGDPEQFADWYRTVDGLNKAYKFEIWFAPNNGVTSFQSTQFFPLDGKGFGNEGNSHNYHFTTEIHTRFKYEGGESFKFTGDDDVWVFINGKLAIDLGGVHNAEDAAVDIDARASELGLVKGNVYPFDMFQNERHTADSNFRADTTLNFVDCGSIVADVPK